MSYKSLLRHRVVIERQAKTTIDGTVVSDWTPVASNEPCFLDFQFIRRGRDPQWTPEAGRPADRSGVAFFGAKSKVRVGDRLRTVKNRGPAGTYMVEGAFDTVYDGRGNVHHIEAGVKEVPPSIAVGVAP